MERSFPWPEAVLTLFLAFKWRIDRFFVALLYGIFFKPFRNHFSSSKAMVSSSDIPCHLALSSSFLMNDSHYCSCSSDIRWEHPHNLDRRSERGVASFPPRVGQISFGIPSGSVGRIVSGSSFMGCQVLSWAQFLYTIFALLSVPRKKLRACGYMWIFIVAMCGSNQFETTYSRLNGIWLSDCGVEFGYWHDVSLLQLNCNSAENL